MEKDLQSKSTNALESWLIFKVEPNVPNMINFDQSMKEYQNLLDNPNNKEDKHVNDEVSLSDVKDEYIEDELE